MSNPRNFDFGKFIPGFDFLQNLAQGASQTLPQMPNLSSWVAPTLNLEELEKRIGELKAVHFWLDQNSKALAATVQALEVQKMTLATLKDMNVNMGEIADAFWLKPAGAAAGNTEADANEVGAAARPLSGVAAKAKAAYRPASRAGAAVGGVVDPLQWWGALTRQFQQIAATAMKDAAAQTTAGASRAMAAGKPAQAAAAAAGSAASSKKSGKTGKSRRASAKRAGPSMR